MKKTLPVVALLIALSVGWDAFSGSGVSEKSEPVDQSESIDDFKSGAQTRGSGVVIRVLSDDITGSRHQRFILRLSSSQTVLIAHNIDLAPRIDSLSKGDIVSFYGEFEHNSQGGLIHWTHRDPAGQHVDGWLKHRGRTYQ